ncbi:MAG: lytic transglycosylase domain-containing protein [Chitinophagaceae bacterium]|nr:lytic transglycosylase domain-containing protein [Chitinophagaceae bacterium]
MKLILFVLGVLASFSVFAQNRDTTLIEEKSVIEEVIASKDSVAPDKEKVSAIREITKYGFKDLFTDYSYNPAIPYSQQINPYAEGYMADYLQTHTAHLKNLKKSATPYFNFIDGILSQYGLPHELKYLAVIESDLKSHALSSAGARGPWQFMPSTARNYGLRVGQGVDERTDYEKSTRAAAKYLLNLYKDLNDWLLVIAAYNGGPGRVTAAIKKSGSTDFWKLQYYLPQESRNHVKKFIATHFVMEENKDPESFYAKELNTEDNLPDSIKNMLSTIVISGRYSAKAVASVIEVEQDFFSMINPKMEQVLASGEEYNLRLPADKVGVFEERKNEILNRSVQELLNQAIEGARPKYEREKKKN